MYEKLLEQMKHIPLLYEQGEPNFWDDEHISKQMLAAHLDPDTEAASRKHSFIKKSATWIGTISNVSSSSTMTLLDLGCGPGLYTEQFSQLGFKVTGIDFSHRSIEYAKDHAKKNGVKIEYDYMNYLDLKFYEQFDVITFIYCDYGVLSDSNRQKILQNAYNALKPGGILILDGNTKANYNNFTNSTETIYQDCGFFSASPYVCMERHIIYEKTCNYLEQHLILTADSLKCYNIWNKAFDCFSLEYELTKQGFLPQNFFADIAGKPMTESSNTICVVARKPLS